MNATDVHGDDSRLSFLADWNGDLEDTISLTSENRLACGKPHKLFFLKYIFV